MTAPSSTQAIRTESALSAELQESVTDFLRESRAPNTRRAYRAAVAAFAAFAEASGRSAIPAASETVAAYLSHQANEGRRCSTVSLHAAAVSYAHRVAGHPNPCDSALVREVVRGIRRTTGAAPKQAAAMTLPRLAQVVMTLDRTSVRGRRDAALLTLGFALAARRSELVALDVEDLEDDGEGLLIRVRRSKTDQEGQGGVLYVHGHQEIRPLLLDLGLVRRAARRHGCQPVQGLRPVHAVHQVHHRQVRQQHRLRPAGHHPEGRELQGHARLKGKSDIGDKINTQVIQPLIERQRRLARSDFPDFNDSNKLGEGQAKVDR
jgi:hypothetical protein